MFHVFDFLFSYTIGVLRLKQNTNSIRKRMKQSTSSEYPEYAKYRRGKVLNSPESEFPRRYFATTLKTSIFMGGKTKLNRCFKYLWVNLQEIKWQVEKRMEKLMESQHEKSDATEGGIHSEASSNS